MTALAGLAEAAGVLRARDYRRWFLAQILSASGGSTQAVGMAWLVVQLGGGGLELALVTGVLFLPTLLLGAALGGLADRHDRRRLLILTQAAQIVLCLGLTVLAATGTARMWSLVAFSLATGVAFAVDQPARQLYVLDLVGRDRVASAISLNEVVINASRILGPALGGAVLAISGTWVCFLVNGLTYVPALIVLLITRPAATTPVTAAAGRGDIRAGLRYCRRTPAIRACLLLAVTAGAVYNISVVMPLMVTRVFHAGGGALGVLTAMFGVGAVPGAILSAAAGREPTGPEVRRLALATGVAVVLCALAPTLPLMMVALAVVGAVSIWFIARANALVLISAEPRLRGRVMGVWTAALPGMNPVTGLLVGGLAGTAGPRAAYAVAGGAATVAALSGWRALRRTQEEVF
ncbi:MFS transporter [Actinoplanes sp. NPDC051851]|uniref:MFS transporter n=1 Tax=Actinoplanes sp. NPDC051851 TaxID=3154753 RepID=UPI003416BCCB